MGFKFSVAMAAYNSEEFIGEAIDSIINQSIGFKENIEIIVVNDCSSDNTEEIVKSFIGQYPENIKLVTNEENRGPSYSRNIALKQASGEYINFLDSDDLISKNAFSKVLTFFEQYGDAVDMVAIPIYFFGQKQGPHNLNYKFDKTGIVNLFEYPEKILLSSASSFFRASILKDKQFNENLTVSEDALLINQILLNKPMYGIIGDEKYYYRKKDESLIGQSASDKSYFTTRIDEYFSSLISDSIDFYNRIPDFIQYVVMYDLQWIFEIQKIDNILNDKELRILYKKLFTILDFIDDNVIFNQKFIPSSLKAHIILLKYFKWDYLRNKEFNFKELKNKLDFDELYNKPFVNLDKKGLNFIINEFGFNTVNIDIFEFKDKNTLYISAYLTTFLNKDIDVYAVANGVEILTNKVNYPQRTNYSLNFNYGYNHSFEVEIPLNLNHNSKLRKINRENINSKIESIKEESDYYFYNDDRTDYEYSQGINSENIGDFLYNQLNKLDNPSTNKDVKISFRTNIDDLNELCSDLGLQVPERESNRYLSAVDIDFASDLAIDFTDVSRLNHISKYKLSKDYISKVKKRHISISNRTFSKVLSNELNILSNFIQKREQGWRSAFVLRILYFILYPFYRNKRIWIFMDLPTRADDNGIDLFKYISKVDNFKSDNTIKKVFAFEKNHELINDMSIESNKDKIKRLLSFYKASDDFKKIKGLGDIVAYRSLKHRLYALYAEKIICSHPDNNIIYPFWGNFQFLSGLLKSKTVFLQHGVTKDDISYWLNKYDKNLQLLVTVSELERDSFVEGNYGYSDDVIQVLGFPRFDLLDRLEDKKEIIIMPTWRRSLHNLGDDDFKKSEFYKNFNNLFNDRDLLDELERYNYKLIFKPHPNLAKYLDLFDKNDSVEFDKDKSYFEIFNHSSLLVTDYSSVSFDFAYLKKPVVYYHYADDYHFDSENGYFKYDSMGFGEVIKSHNELVDIIVKYVKSDCRMDDIYRDRVDDFFKYDDKNNCKRVYEAILDLDDYY